LGRLLGRFNDVMNKNAGIVLIERYSLLALLLVVISRGNIFLYKVGMVDYFPNHRMNRTIWEKIATKIYGADHIHNVPNYSNNFKLNSKVVWQSHQEALSYLEKFSEYFKKATLGMYVVDLIASEKVLIAIQKQILEKVSRKILLLKVYEHYRAQGVVIDRVLFENYDSFFYKQYIKPHVLTKSDILLSMINHFKFALFSLLYVLLSPVMIREIFRRGVRFTRINETKYDVGIHMAWGFANEDTVKKDKMKLRSKDLNDALLINRGEINAKKTAFIYSRWSFSEKEKEVFSLVAEKMGADCVHEDNNKVSVDILFLYLKNNLYMLFFYLMSLLKGEFYPLWFIHDIQKVINRYFMQMVFCKYYKIKVFVSRDDYDYEHIVRTICQNKYGLINTGIQHSAFIDHYKIPQSAHVYFDIYYTMGDGFSQLWSPYWQKNKRCISVGPHRDFSILDACNDNYIKARYDAKYKGKVTVLMLISKHDNSNSPYWLLNEKYKDLDSIFELDDRLHLILRPRSVDAVNTLLSICPKLRSYMSKGKCSVELEDFTTQELIPYVDIFVAEDASSSLLESLIVENLFSIYFMVRYGDFIEIKDMVVHDSQELKDMIYSYFKKDSKYKEASRRREFIREKYIVLPMGVTWERIGDNINKILGT